MTKPPNTDDTPTILEVKHIKTDDRPNKKRFQMQLQGMGLAAFNKALQDRQETPQQLLNDLLTEYLMREDYLPNWWLTRQGIE